MVGELLGEGERVEDAGELALTLGLLTGLFALTTTTMAQIERGANRIYGGRNGAPGPAEIPPRRRAGRHRRSARARRLPDPGRRRSDRRLGTGSTTSGVRVANGIWNVVRFPLSLALTVLAVAVLFRQAPRRNQPGLSWLFFGAGIATALWWLASLLLAAYVRFSDDLGQTYGALTGMMALLLWANLTGMALFGGLAFAAQLEALRIGVREPAQPDLWEPEADRAGLRRHGGDAPRSSAVTTNVHRVGWCCGSSPALSGERLPTGSGAGLSRPTDPDPAGGRRGSRRDSPAPGRCRPARRCVIVRTLSGAGGAVPPPGVRVAMVRRDNIAVPESPHCRHVMVRPAGFEHSALARRAGRGGAPFVDEVHDDPGEFGLVPQHRDGPADLPLPQPQVVPPPRRQIEDTPRVPDGQGPDPVCTAQSTTGFAASCWAWRTRRRCRPSTSGSPAASCATAGNRAGPVFGARAAVARRRRLVSARCCGVGADRPPGHQQPLPVGPATAYGVDDSQVDTGDPARIRSRHPAGRSATGTSAVTSTHRRPPSNEQRHRPDRSTG